QLCRIFGLFGAGSTPSLVTQWDPNCGAIIQYACAGTASNPNPAPEFLPGQAVMIQPSVDASGVIPGTECAEPYTSYTDTAGSGPKGHTLVPTPIPFVGGGLPLTTTSGGARDICNQLGLPAGTSIVQFKACTPAAIQIFTCGQAGPAAVALRVGEGVMIQPG